MFARHRGMLITSVGGSVVLREELTVSQETESDEQFVEKLAEATEARINFLVSYITLLDL
jgi:hypothetical protein